MRYGFAIDQNTCIGCHACTVACKTEHEIPVGQFRTWVKYVESGEFPATTRDFGVMRCNHCTDAPCVTICPTQALFKRDDGIVDSDNERCIGCKACMQGCPYDAIYIDADTNTAAKCNVCAHRVDEGLEPACVVVCPTHSIWVDDLDDPESGIAKLVNTNPTQVRAPEQNTGPNVFYLGADRAVLDPTAAPTGDSYLWARPDEHRREVSRDLPVDPVTTARTTLNTAHPRPWGWRVTTYLWTNPDGFTWIETLTDPDTIGLHVALTPTWSETAEFADYVLPMGHSSERHDTHSYETHAGKWLGFRQPVRRVAMDKLGERYTDTRDVNPGEVWEENEFWFELSWRIDPDGALGITKYVESPYRSGEKITTDDYYRWMFEHSVPGLPEKAAAQGMTPLEYMRRYGVVEVDTDIYRVDERPLTDTELADTTVDEQGVVRKPVTLDSVAPVFGEAGELVLVPTFRLPTLIHTRSGNAKYLNEISNTHPVWLNSVDAARHGVRTDDLVRISTEIGYFVARVWVTEGIRPGVCALSHHMGRWRLHPGEGSRWVSGMVELSHPDGEHTWLLRHKGGVAPFDSTDPDSSRIDWEDPGVHQNLAFAVQPDPHSGMHCWLQKIRMEPARDGDRYGDVYVDTRRSAEVYREWLAKTRPALGPGGQRRPEFMMRPLAPTRRGYRTGR
ncbi:4Fe-4S dicluster domain-containing protein [Haloechinothrix halophila]|uniref:4Fe-4S dicluster domain-containing protein n=1 Tax=Haloechinothrix halophila TaxID=1069073 RepID=UPI0003F8CC9B|nr:4Fe-4S dicluster domain-containing protein [Haloechinothrix halophila]